MKKQTKTTAPKDESSGEQSQSVLIEMRVPQAEAVLGAAVRAGTMASTMGFVIDPDFSPVPVRPSNTQRMEMLAANEDNEHIVVKASLTDAQRQEAMANPNVVEIWSRPHH